MRLVKNILPGQNNLACRVSYLSKREKVETLLKDLLKSPTELHQPPIGVQEVVRELLWYIPSILDQTCP